MINETSTSPYAASGSMGPTGSSTGVPLGSSQDSVGIETEIAGGGPRTTVHRMAHRAHEAIDRLEQTLGNSSDRMVDWQQEYGEAAREQVRSNPLAAVGVAFSVGLLFGRLLMR